MLSPLDVAKIKVTKQGYIYEIVRIAKKLETYPVAVRSDEYNKHCKPGYSAQRVRTHLGMSYTEGVKESGLQKREKQQVNPSMNKRPSGTVKCGNITIQLNECVPGNRPGCATCEGNSLINVKAIPNISDEEAREYAHNTSRYMNGNTDLDW